jgi:Pvc16 N-terminal domain
MSDFTAIKAVTETLEQLLVTELAIAVETKKAPHDITTTAPLVALFLYRVEINSFLANLEWQKTAVTQLTAPPFGLNLHYLVTPYGPDQIEIQKTLGEVMLTFHEHAVIAAGDPVLAPDLATMTEELRIVPRPLALSDSIELWKSFEKVPYRLAATYEVSAILIDSRTTRTVTPVQERHLDLSLLR